MENNFEEFLDQVEPFDDVGDLDDALNVETGNILVEDESKSVNRFRSLENSPPSLCSLSIVQACAWINDLTCDPANNNVVLEFYKDRVKLLPVDLQTKINSQLSFSSLRCIYQDKVWDLDPLLLAAGIKQEEDMLRYLFWKDPTHPLLRHFEKSLVIDVFEDKVTKESSNRIVNSLKQVFVKTLFDNPSGGKRVLKLLNEKNLALTDHVKSALVQPYNDKCFNYQFCEKDVFMKEFATMTGGSLKTLNWKNVLVVGGSVLKSLRHKVEANREDYRNHYNSSDIDIYIYGLSTDQARAKVEEIYNTVKSCWKNPNDGTIEEIGIFKTANTITLVSGQFFRNIQIILSTYASPLEILLASDMNSCSIGFNGETVLTISRFLFGAMYGSNVLDSSTKFGTKLRWERLTKYYLRDYNIVSPLHLRVHGHGSFNSDEPIDKHMHPSTRQIVELMCLNKMKLLGPNGFGVNRESEFNFWPMRWTRGINIMHRGWPKRSFYNEDDKNEYGKLCDILPNPPGWVKDYYKSAQNLTLPWNSIREAPRYSEDQRTLGNMAGLNYYLPGCKDHSRNFNPALSNDVHKYIEEHCRFDEYNESSLQCFHLNFFVDKQRKEVNPYKEMNTSLATLHYDMQTIPLIIKDFDKLLSGDLKTISTSFKLLNKNWKLSFTWGSHQVSFMSLMKEKEDKDDGSEFNNTKTHPTKVFANFLLRIKALNNVTLNENWHKVPRDITFDGSQVFTYTQPSDTWLMWVRNDYFRGTQSDAAGEEWLQYVQNSGINGRPKYVDEDGSTHWEVTIQIIEPRFNITNL